MSTSILLLHAIRNFVESVVNGGVIDAPAVHLGELPKKNKDNADVSEFPYIIVRPAIGEDTDDECKVSVHLIFGSKSGDDIGFMDMFNQMERVRVALLRQRVIERKFKMLLPYKWEYPAEQPEPYTFGIVTTTWILPRVQEEEGLF